MFLFDNQIHDAVEQVILFQVAYAAVLFRYFMGPIAKTYTTFISM